MVQGTAGPAAGQSETLPTEPWHGEGSRKTGCQAGETYGAYRTAEEPVAQCELDRGDQTISCVIGRQAQFRGRHFYQGTDLGHRALPRHRPTPRVSKGGLLMLLKEPLKQILIDGRDIWDNNDTQPFVRETFRKMIRCRTAALGWQVYASDTEERRVYHTCKARSCPSCGYRATLQWQREQWTQLPDISYSGLVFTMPGRLWHIFKENRHLLHDLPTLGSEAVL